jgi:hypothetical protein
MATKVRKLTPEVLKAMIVQEARKLQKETLELGAAHPSKVKAVEVDADGYADTLEKKIDHLKVLKLQEAKLLKQLRKIREAREKLSKLLVDGI